MSSRLEACWGLENFESGGWGRRMDMLFVVPHACWLFLRHRAIWSERVG